jgi:uncharacterized metal-binding protein YceD (DUF177 family)
MASLVEYLIPYKGLSIGKHDYQYHVTDTFFEALESTLVEKGDLYVNLVLDKQSRLITVDIHIKGHIKLLCDRCLDEFDFPIDSNYQQIYKFGAKPDRFEDDLIYLQDNDYQIDLSLLILENIILEIPIKRVHPNDSNGKSTCSKTQLNLLKNFTKKSVVDPRWEALKNIKFED